MSPCFWNQDLKHYSYFCNPCMGAPANKNLSGPQKELLKWDWKSGKGMYPIQFLMCEHHYEDPDGKTTILAAIIKPKFPTAQSCGVPTWQLCLLARARKHSPKVSWTQPLSDCEGALTRDQYKLGDFVSTTRMFADWV
jgi:hypothetical protein